MTNIHNDVFGVLMHHDKRGPVSIKTYACARRRWNVFRPRPQMRYVVDYEGIEEVYYDHATAIEEAIALWDTLCELETESAIARREARISKGL